MKPMVLEIEYDQFAHLVKPDEWLGFCRWIADEPDNLFDIEELVRKLASEATQQEKESWSEDGVDIKGLMKDLEE